MNPPRVFISYSHDSPGHKSWVEGVAIALRKNGVDTTLDQWDLAPGDDVTLFMDKGVTDSDRVIVVCTDTYVTKANAGIGGVGYERLIVTSELVRNAGTNKFIPIVRNVASDQKTPTFLATRKYVDFSKDEAFVESIDLLLRELHKQPPAKKPPLGKSPFALSTLGEQISASPDVQPTAVATSEGDAPSNAATAKSAQSSDSLSTDTEALSDPQAVYDISRNALLHPDHHKWQLLTKKLSGLSATRLQKWREQRQTANIRALGDMNSLLDEAVEKIVPLYTCSLTAVESGRTEFSDQSGLIFDLLNIREWNPSGTRWMLELPISLAWAYHNLHGSLCMNTGQIDIAIRLVERKVQVWQATEFRRICQHHSLLGWPPALDGNSLNGWNYISTAYERWKWPNIFFSSNAEYLEALVAYFMVLNIHELVLLLTSGVSVNWAKPDSITPDVPLNFTRASDEAGKRALLLLLQQPSKLRSIWETRGVPHDVIRDAWPKWIKQCEYWVSRSARHWFAEGSLPHEKLFDAI